RLRYYLDRITDNKTTTYRYNVKVDGRLMQKEIYDGECEVIFVKPNGERDKEFPGTRREPTFWDNNIAYTLERTNKMALDRPTVTIAIPVSMLGIYVLTPAAADYCLRAIGPYFEAINAQYANRSRTDRDNGKFYVYDPGSKVLVRNTAYFDMMPAMDYTEGKGNTIYFCEYIDPPPDIMCLCVRMEIQLPYLKLDRAKTMLLKQLPDAVERFVQGFDRTEFESAVKLEEKQQAIRKFLREGDYCAFIANGSILARERGSDKPAKSAIPFQSPPDHEIEVAGVKGMGIKQGVTVITGGGYSGKSTVLNAISEGIYNHAAGDGRELCITDDTAVTITAEDGRAVSDVNLSPFIKWIPGGDPVNFSTTHASGSTSQGANIMEAVSMGSKLLLIDEDRSATNFMIRDAVMKALIEKEPITPFTDRVQELAGMGVSTILVIGGSGEYLAVADQILMMDEFVMGEVTERAKVLVPDKAGETTAPEISWDNRCVMPGGFTSYPKGSGRERLSISDTGFIVIGDERIDIRSLHDIATPAQANALAFMLRYLAKGGDGLESLEAMALAMRGLSAKKGAPGQGRDIVAEVQKLYDKMEQESEGLNLVDTGFFTSMERYMDMPRKFELLAAINRMRHLIDS
ncbi:MAG: ABC-ATPase domain-containing protein, partial [Defluviitaleaceae bacterium]|nr:ABC-ATPase domain-containing protein [Defluviitaleaceae bacterium]